MRDNTVMALKELGKTLCELGFTYINFITREITIGEFCSRFRKPDALFIQGAFLAVPLLVGTAVGIIPLWATLFLLFEMIYAGILLSHAKNMKQQALLTFIWAMTSFAVIACGIFIYAYIDSSGSLSF